MYVWDFPSIMVNKMKLSESLRTYLASYAEHLPCAFYCHSKEDEIRFEVHVYYTALITYV